MMEENELKNKSVETYAEDMARAIESNKGGLIKKIIHEEEEHEAEKKNFSPESKRNKLFMLVGTGLAFLSLAVLVYLIFYRDQGIDAVPATPFFSMIFTDQTDFVAIDGLARNKIAETVSAKAASARVKAGGIEGIYPTKENKVVGFGEFSALIKSSLVLSPADLISDNFLLGAASSPPAGKNNFFILLETRSFTDVFPALRSWEEKMLYDLGGFFGVKISPETNYLFTKDFENGIIANKNARILYDNNKKIVLMYVFINDSYVIVTDSEIAIREVILRLASSRIKK